MNEGLGPHKVLELLYHTIPLVQTSSERTNEHLIIDEHLVFSSASLSTNDVDEPEQLDDNGQWSVSSSEAMVPTTKQHCMMRQQPQQPQQPLDDRYDDDRSFQNDGLRVDLTTISALLGLVHDDDDDVIDLWKGSNE
jgi:hypothetical protein